MGEKRKQIRVMLSMSPEDEAHMDNLTNRSYKQRVALINKAVHILLRVEKEEVFLHTREGARIPKSIIFS